MSEYEFETFLQDSISKLKNLTKLRNARIYVKTDFNIEANTRPLHVLAMAQGFLWLGFSPQYTQATLLQISYKAMKNPLWHNIKK